MSLQVWLPFNNTIDALNNYGVSTIRPTINGTSPYTITTGGKTGMYCMRTNTTGKIDLGINGDSLNTHSVSFGGWFKFNKERIAAHLATLTYPTTSPAPTGSLIGNGSYGGIGLIWYANTTSQVDTFSTLKVQAYLRSSSNGARGTTQYIVPFDTWIHLLLHYDITTKRITFYINGNPQYYLDNPNFAFDAPSRNLFINYNGIMGGNGPGAYLPFDCADIRVYDHCLSQVEIYEISKAKLIHLKLDNGGFGQENIAHNSQGVWVSNLGSADGSRREYQAKSLGQSFPVTSGTKVTLSFDVHMEIKTARGANTRKLFVYNTNNKGPHHGWVSKDLWYSQAFAVGDIIDEHISLVTTVNDKSDSTLSVDWIEFYSEYGTNNWYSISNLHIEVGEVETPWAPNSTDTFYMSSQLGTQFDCSGYQHNAITNSITHSSDTARHICSSVFNGSSSYIKVNDITWMADRMPAITINLWAKVASAWPTAARLFSCTEGGGFNCEAGNSGYWRFPVHVYTSATEASVAYKFDSNEIKLSDLPVGEWVMLTWVYDNFGTRTYINGELHHTYLNNSYGIHFNTGARLFLGCEANAANPSSPYFNGQMSDFRIYATAMSQADIRLLYRTSGFVDDQGNVFAGELREV